MSFKCARKIKKKTNSSSAPPPPIKKLFGLRGVQTSLFVHLWAVVLNKLETFAILIDR